MVFINRRLAVSVIVCALSYFFVMDLLKMVAFSAKIIRIFLWVILIWRKVRFVRTVK